MAASKFGSRKIFPGKKRNLARVEHLDYSMGLNSFDANDVVDPKSLVYITNSRISSFGRTKTRRGLSHYSTPAGQAQDQAITSSTGAADKTVSTSAWIAQKFTAGVSTPLTKVQIEVKNDASGTGPLIVEIQSDSSGPSGTVLARSSIASSTITGSYAYCDVRFIDSPVLASGTSYWIVAYIQDNGTNDYKWNSTTSATTAMTSTSGVTWSATSYAMHIKTFNSTAGATKGLYRAYKSDGTKATLMAHGTVLYSVSDVDGSLTSVKTGLNSSATDYYFATANDIVYYVNGVDAPRKWNFSTDAANTGTSTVSSNIILHKDKMFFVDATSPTRVYFSNITDYETFTSTDFLYVPSPKSADPITAWAVINDNLIIWTRETKWVLYGADLSSFTLRRAAGLKGTFTQDTVAYTRNYAFFLSDDGIYRFDGSTDKIISQKITDKIGTIVTQTNARLEIWNNRLYVFYTSSGSDHNDNCLVYNINYDSWESLDTDAHIAKTYVQGGVGDSNEFLQASAHVGQVFYGESSSNNYDNLGKPIDWEIRTRYEHFNDPSSKKRMKRWYPRFATQTSGYTVSVKWDKDFRNSPTTQTSVSMSASGTTWGGGSTWGGGDTWGSAALINPRTKVPGTANYIQRRYSKSGVGTPVEFLGESIYFQTRRAK